METSLQGQVYIFLSTLLGGMGIGLIYDFYRLFRYYSKPKRIKTFIEDLIFWLLLSVIIILFVNRINEGEYRGYIIIGFTIGIFLYSRLLSKYVIKFISSTINFIIFKIKSIFKTILKPFILIKEKLKGNLMKIKKYINLPRIIYASTVKGIKTIIKKK